MTLRCLWFSIAVLLANYVQADKDNIVKLNKFNFDHNVKNGVWFVKFYAPWCTHCQRLAPIWEKFADQAAAKAWPVKVADVDCTVSKPICEKANVKGIPTLALINEGVIKGKYRGDASVNSLQAWLVEQGVMQAGSGGAPAVQPEAPSPSPSEKITEEARPGPTHGTTATHGRALKAILQNAVTRFPTENIITNMYFYFLVTMFLVVVFYVMVFQMLEEEHEKDS